MNQQGVKHQEYPDKGRGRAFLSFFSNDIIIEQNRFIKMNQQSCQSILGLLPHDKAAMFGVNTKEFFFEEFT